ncbi:MAG TPA: S8 family serine peptidase [Burkholderiales bacterium]|nr:S8 family serine peptidase [Burkholderiales bacterium]
MAEALENYRQDPNVLYAEPNYVVHTTAIPDDTRFGELWGLHNTGQSGGTPGADIDALGAWDTATGSSSVVVAVIDTGIDYNHPDLSANMFRNTADCIANGIDDDGNGRIDDCYGIDTANNDSDPMDDNEHGTHVAGTIGASGNNATGVAGINWNVSLMACKFLAASGSGTLAGAIGCLEYVRTMKDRGVNVVATNNSWGGGGFSQALFDAIKGHQEAGILFVAAAGNGNAFGVGLNNDQTPFYPCNYNLSNVICVAASTRTDERATFSNYGRRTVHIGAPGAAILSTTPNNTYATFNGTSMATPHVTGTAALLKAADPARDWRAIRNLILAGGESIPSMENTVTQKRLNALGALTCANSPVFSRLTPIADTVLVNVDTPLNLSVLNINCALPNGDVVVTVSPGGESVTLLDDGVGVDQAAGDGNYSGQWIPASTGSYTLTFPDGSELAVTVSSPLISVAPEVLDFGTVNANAFFDRAFTVQNAGSGTLTGSASTAAPFAIQSGASYSLSAGQSQTVTVRFSPTTVGTISGTVNFTGGGAASKVVTGVVVPPATLAANPTSAMPGATITASWSGIAAPTTRDWIGIYQPGAPDTSYYLGWLYLTGAASGSVPFTLATSLAPGTYELRLFSNGSYSRLAVATITVVPGCTGGALSASPTSVAAGGSVTATWSAVCTPTGADWIGLYLPGAPDSAYLSYRYTTGTASGSVPFTIPTSVAPGTYELRLFTNNSLTRLAVSNSFQVVAGCSGGSLGASPANVPAGGSVTAAWSGLCGPTSKDWVGVFLPGAANTSYVAWGYTTGAASGSISLVLPGSLAQGTYELRLFSNGSYTRLATSNTFTVGAACSGGANLSASPASVPRGGTVTATWSNVCSPTSRDWIGVFAPGAPNSYYVAWRYTTGTASGSVPLTIPSSLAPGTYELRLFANNGYLLLGKSNAFSVTSP